MTKTLDFGWVIGRVKFNNQGQIDELCLVCPSDASEHVFTPAQSITIYGNAAIEELRKLLNGETGEVTGG